MLTGNIGEWSEIYALFKLLSDGKLAPGDENMEKIKDVFYPIVKILRTESNGSFEYTLEDEIVISSQNSELLRIPIHIFKEKTEFLLNKIKNNKERTFSIPEIETFMNEIKCISLKADSSSKTDINIIIHDFRTNQQPLLGFSIKSQLGGASTLLNPGKPTNFIFKVHGDKIINELEKVNSTYIKRGEKLLTDVKGRLKIISKNDGVFEFINIESSIFENNLILIDSLLPQILSEIILEYFSSNSSKLKDLVETIHERNPLKFNLKDKHSFYSYKIKRLLTDIALGMTPSKVWTGDYHATGGYLIVKDNGDVICYHIYDKKEFENYLINNTKLDSASASRYEYGELYLENEELFFKLNLQIRFIK